MSGAQPMVSRRGLLVSGFTAGGAIATVLSRLPSAGRDVGLAGAHHSASPVATPVAEAIEITIEAIDLRFSPATLAVPARTSVRIVFTNRSRVYHDLVIPRLGRRTRRIGPDETSEFLIQAEPGSYEFYCSIQSHHQAGMAGTITAR